MSGPSPSDTNPDASPATPAGEGGGKPDLIGRKGEPILALTFAGGAYSTAIQAGVIHALLVSRGRAPDVVVGISAGAINAAALAEVLQAGSPTEDKAQGAPKPHSSEDDERLPHKIARFREIFYTFQKTPGHLLSAMLPDSLQIDTKNPLEPLKLPIYADKERKARDQSLHARSGLMNLFNKILGLRLPIGIIARLIRRWLGLNALAEVRPLHRRLLIMAGEILRIVELAGLYLHRLAPLMGLLVGPSLTERSSAPEGASAGELISRPWILRKMFLTIIHILSLMLLVSVWVLLAPVVLAGAALIAVLCGIPVGWDRFKRWFKETSDGKKKPRRVGERPIGQMARSSGRFVLSFLVTWCVWMTALWMGIVLILSVVGQTPKIRTWALIPIPYWSSNPPGIAGWISIGLCIVGTLLLVNIYLRRGRLLDNILRRNTLNEGILDPHPLRNLLVRIFDEDFYGRLNMKDVVDHALADLQWAPREPRETKKLSHYSNASPPIRVGVAAANVETGELETLLESESVVKALLAATAVVPAFPAQRPGERGPLYVDGTNVANEPTWPLINFLKSRIPKCPGVNAQGDVNQDATAIHLYSVSPLPFSRPQLELETAAEPACEDQVEAKKEDKEQDTGGGHWPLVDVATRAIELRNFRDATLERRLTELHSLAMDPECQTVVDKKNGSRRGNEFLRAWVYPIEPVEPLNVNRRLFDARSEGERRRVIAETVADGCRVALEAMIPKAIDGTQLKLKRRGIGEHVACRDAIREHLKGRNKKDLPGSDPKGGPGLSEVCRHCTVRRCPSGEAESEDLRYRLVNRQKVYSPPKDEGGWPLARTDGKPETSRPTDGKETAQPDDQEEKERKDEAIVFREHLRKANLRWPLPRHDESAGCSWEKPELPEYLKRLEQQQHPGEDGIRNGPHASGRPTVSLLFSGGVFRGVYQVGVANALSEIGLRPDIVAGASVGSITAAMVARLFAGSRRNPDLDREYRARKLQSLAATYMAIDRLVLTDRFSDFIRTLTVRAAETRFSLRQADRVMRQYDQAMEGRYGKEARIVMAGLERLFYLSPFELRELVEALRLRETHRVVQILKDSFQELLERGGVGEEVLGTEPLALLIAEHVLGSENGETRLDAEFDDFLGEGIYFLATTTNLTKGRLEILGERQFVDEDDRYRVSLRQGLLASSAFPGVFRPRKAWEVMPSSGSEDLLTDGGVMDNLPLDAVAQFLMRASRAGLIEKRPCSVATDGTRRHVPHLLFSASLEVDPPRELPHTELEELKQDWRSLFQRTRRLGYNQKLRLYDETQKALRRLWRKRDAAGQKEDGKSFRPLDLDLFTIRPRWLCGTFAFHPMLGFRRRQSARSIAHGCASTLLKFGDACDDSTQLHNFKAWGMEVDRLPKVVRDGCGDLFELPPSGRNVTPGRCWYRPGICCPFSPQAPKDPDLGASATKAINMIYEECGNPAMHRGTR